MTDYKLVPVLGDGLLPCPFCGKPPTEYDQIGYSSVKCRECKFSIKVKSEDGPPYAPDLWNRRAAPDVQGERQQCPVCEGAGELRWLGGAGDEHRCESCDGTGDVHSPDGEWRGECHCIQVENHPDDVAVDRFAAAMKGKMAAARLKGRSGWNDPGQCTDAHLAKLLLEHLHKGNPGTFEDVANFCMMLYQRGADPAVLRAEQEPVAEPAEPAEIGEVRVSVKNGSKFFEFEEYSVAYSLPEGLHYLYTAPPTAPDVSDLAAALDEAKSGLEWYQQEYPEAVSDCDHEVMERIDAALSAYREQHGGEA